MPQHDSSPASVGRAAQPRGGAAGLGSAARCAGTAQSRHDARMTAESAVASAANATIAAPAAVAPASSGWRIARSIGSVWSALAPAPRLGLALIAGAAVALELAVSGRYGYRP